MSRTRQVSAVHFRRTISIMKDNRIGNHKTIWIERTAAIAAVLVVWEIAARMLDQKILLASPWDVLLAFGELLHTPEFYQAVAGSFVGSICAVISAKVHLIEILLWPYMAAVKAAPVASFIILCLVWLSPSGLSVFISFLIVVPVVYTNLLNGIRSLNPQMKEFAECFGIRPWKRLIGIDLPQMRPYIVSSFEIAIGMAWKAGIAAEVIGTPDGSIGKMLYHAKIYLATPELFAWTILVIFISVLFEKAVTGLLRLGYQRLEYRI